MVVLPVRCLCLLRGALSFESIRNKKEAKIFFKNHFPTVIDDIENISEDFFKNPTSAMVTMKCYPWTYWDKAALVGDSAHAIVPFLWSGNECWF